MNKFKDKNKVLMMISCNIINVDNFILSYCISYKLARNSCHVTHADILDVSRVDFFL